MPSPVTTSRSPLRRAALKIAGSLSVGSVFSAGCIVTKPAAVTPVPSVLGVRAPAARARVEPKESEARAMVPPAPVRIETLTKAEDWIGHLLNVDAPITFKNDEGSVVGFLRKGTVVHVGADWERSNWVEVMTGFPRVEPTGGFRRRPSEGMTAYVSKFVESGNLPKEMVHSDTHSEEVRYGLFRELLLTPGGKPFSYVKCGKVKLHERDATGAYVRVDAEYPAGELFGWMQVPENNEPDYECASLMLDGEHSAFPRSPVGYYKILDRIEKFEAFARKGGHVYWGNKSDHRQCSEWKFEAPSRGGAGLLVRQKPDLPANVRREVIHYYVGNHGTALSLSCPEVTFADGGNMAGSCIWDYAVVRFNDWHIALVRWSHGGSFDKCGDNELVAYRPESAVFWYFTREECERSTDHDPEPRPQPSEPR
jgi:hypothetical protein